MSKVNKKEGGLFSKVGNLFESKEEKVLEAKVVSDDSFFSGLKNKFFGDNNTENIIDIEAFEIVAEDMELVIIEKDIDDKGLVVESRGILNVLSDTVSSTLGVVKDTAGSAIDSVKSVTTDSLNFTTDKLGVAKQATVEFSSSTADSLVHYTKEIGRKYDEMEISPKFYSLINTMDLVMVISGLQLLIEKQRKGSKEFIALSLVISVLLLLDRSKEEMKKEMGIIEVNEELNHDLASLLKSVTFKEVVETAEPILLIIPNGNYILLILKLFV